MNKYERKGYIEKMIIELGRKVDGLSSEILKNMDSEGNYNKDIKVYIRILRFDIVKTLCDEIIDFFTLFNNEVSKNDIKVIEWFRNMLGFRLDAIVYDLNNNSYLNTHYINDVINYFNEICNFYEYYKDYVAYR